jgi:radical SAM protein with 4Fe4S-binding SPASM domain
MTGRLGARVAAGLAMHLREMTHLGRQALKTFRGKTAPLEVGWDVTYRCNAQCAYCTNWTSHHPVMPLSDARKLVERVTRLGTFQMSLSGGEPLTRKDIVPIVQAIRQAGMRCAIVSNGSLGREQLYRELMEAGLNSLIFSLDGATPESHERFRHGTSFEKLIASIETCTRLIAEHGFATRISTNTVLTNSNVEEIPKIAELVRSLGLKDFKFQPVWRQHYAREHLNHLVSDDFNDVYGFTRENEPLLARAVELIRAAGSSNDPDFTERIPDFYLGTERAKELPCYALRAFLSIDAAGNVMPCGKVQQKVGNILDDRWEKDHGAMFEPPDVKRLMHALTKQECGGCAAVAYMERNFLMESIKNPLKLARILASRVER